MYHWVYTILITLWVWFSDAVKSQVGEPVEGIRKDSYRSVGRAHLVNAEKILVAIVAAECWFTTVVFF